MRRVTDADELLDGPLTDRVTLLGNLRDLERANRWLGGVSLSARAIAVLANGKDELRVLDVGTGAADIPLALLDRARRDGRRLHVTGIDSRPEILAAAADRRPRLTVTPALALHVGDGRSLPYPDAAFDIAHASMVVHHLAPDEAVRLLAEMRRVAVIGVVVNDLVRGRLAWLGAWTLAHGLTGNRFTRHDAPLSVRRAYTELELGELLARAGLRVVGEARGFMRHRLAVAAIATSEAPATGDPSGGSR
jgi:SAM-dependent methyltransferase